MNDNRSDILILLIEHESVIGRLYDLLGETFADDGDFWKGLAEDERRHAQWLGTLRSEPMIDAWLLADKRLKPQAVRSSIEYVESLQEKTRAGQVTRLQALSAARDLENALLEKQFPIAGPAVPTEIRSILDTIAADTERHRTMLAGQLQQMKKAAP